MSTERLTVAHSKFWETHFYWVGEEEAEDLAEIGMTDPWKAYGILEIFMAMPVLATAMQKLKWTWRLVMMDECDLEFFEFGDYQKDE